ncbi:MAG: methyltransferase domain-containing protein [Hyphomicrobiales bacterium]|nr:methyltransferase domain-containing protein [Hyphomicrobiales bacterium]
MTEIHSAAASGFSAAAATYAAGRPDYPAALDGWLVETLGLSPGKVAVDLGAGTGKFTPRLLSTGARVIAVEPVAAMRAELAARFAEVEALEGTAQAMPLPDGSVDAVVCAQAFHWFASAEALAEIRRALKPGGALGLVWNERDERTAWVAALTRLMTPHEGDAPRFHSGAWREVFPAEGFSALEETRMRHGHTGPAERVIVDRLLSVSFIAALPEADRGAFATQVRALIAATPELAGGKTATFPYETVAYVCRRTG